MYTKPHTNDNRKNELCEHCRYNSVCNEKNKTYAPLLTACACNIALLEEASLEPVQENNTVRMKENGVMKSRNFFYARFLLERLFCADVLCDTPHTNDPLRNAVKDWLIAYYGNDIKPALDKHPNEKNENLMGSLHGVPKEALQSYTEQDPFDGGLFT